MAEQQDYMNRTDFNPNGPGPIAESTAPKKRRPWVLWVGLLAVGLLYYYANETPTPPSSVEWIEDYDAGLADAAQNQKPVLLAFKATWCGPCKWMDREVFAKDEAAKALTGWVPIHIDVDKQPKLARQYGISGVPTFIVLSPDGRPINATTGQLSLEQFIEFLAASQQAQPAANNH